MGGQGPTVLVIDDNQGLVELLQRYLADQTCSILAATSGAEGVCLAQATVPDAIVLDVMMPQMAGWEVLQRLRNDPRTVHIPVLVCSVINNPELAYSLGAAAFIAKPVGREDILEGLHRIGVLRAPGPAAPRAQSGR